MAGLAWFFFISLIQNSSFDQEAFAGINQLVTLVAISIFWFLIYLVLDGYPDLYRMSRWKMFSSTFVITIVGVTILYLFLLAFWRQIFHNASVLSFIYYCLIHFGLTVVARFTILSFASYRLKKGIVRLKTLLIGGDKNAQDLYKEITESKGKLGT